VSKDISQLSEKEYRSLEIESFSSIKHILESPQTFIHYKEKPFKGSPATLLGTSIHHYLQGNKQLVAFQNLPKLKKNEKENKKFEEDFRKIAGEDGIIVPKAFEEKLLSIEKNFNENKQAVRLLSQCEFEKPYLFTINGVDLKGKIDGVAPEYILEIKSSSQATTAEEFKKEALERDYDMQAYFYTVAASKMHHYFIVVNTQEPYKVAVYRSSYDFIVSGHSKAVEATSRYKRYIINKEKWDDSEIIEEI